MGVTLLPVDWSLALDQFGRTADGLDDVAQCVRVILATPLRSDPHRPDFGCDLQPWIDRPTSEAGPGIIAAVRDALERWEPRLTVLDVAVRPAEATDGYGDGAGVHITVRWQLAGSIAVPATTTVAVGEVRS